MKFLSNSELNTINAIINNCKTKAGNFSAVKLNKFLNPEIKPSTGNKKYVRDEYVNYCIFNIPAVTTCPYRTFSCELLCYARKAERVYPSVLPARQRHLVQTQKASFVVDMILAIYKAVQNAKKRDKKLIVRVHEAGDFYSVEYAKKWLAIAEFFKDEPAVHIGAYTKSSPYLTQLGYKHNMFSNLTINGSVWGDTKTERLNEYARMNLPTYTALPTDEVEKDSRIYKCDCAKCGSPNGCIACFSNDKKFNVKAVAIH